MNKVVQALKDALLLMNDKGAHWTQGTLREVRAGEYAYCSLGAVMQATGADLEGIMQKGSMVAYHAGDFVLRQQVTAVLSKAVPDEVDHETLGRQEANITSWNDDEDREWWEIVKLFEEAQRIAEEEMEI